MAAAVEVEVRVFLVAAIIFLMTASGLMTDLVERFEDLIGVGRIL